MVIKGMRTLSNEEGKTHVLLLPQEQIEEMFMRDTENTETNNLNNIIPGADDAEQ